MPDRSGFMKPSFMLLVAVCGLPGCKNATIKEVRGKTSFGPQFQNQGNNTSQVKYYSVQAIELKLANKWTAGVVYQRTDVDDGSGDNENMVLFEVGYPIWSAKKKPEKTAREIQLQDLEKELQQLDAELVAAENSMPDHGADALAQSGEIDQLLENNKGE